MESGKLLRYVVLQYSELVIYLTDFLTVVENDASIKGILSQHREIDISPWIRGKWTGTACASPPVGLRKVDSTPGIEPEFPKNLEADRNFNSILLGSTTQCQ